MGVVPVISSRAAWLRQVRVSYARLFLPLPEDSRFNRRAQGVREALRYAV